MKSLIIKKKFLDKIFLGLKTWELRGSNTKIRGTIRLIESGSGLIIGEADLVDCVGHLSLDDLKSNFTYTQYDVQSNMLKYKKTYAWILKNPKIYKDPIPYKHPQGAIIWVNT